MIDRYTNQRMRWLSDPVTKFQYWLRVELAIIMIRIQMGELPEDLGQCLIKAASVPISVKRIHEIEAETDHDLLAFVTERQESIGWENDIPQEVIDIFHKDVTSYDIEDSAWALMLSDAVSVILEDASLLRQKLYDRALEHRDTLMIGLTHGQPAEPYTFGLKLLNFLDSLERALGQLERNSREALVGRLAGAIGNHASLPPEYEQKVCEELGLTPVRISTQIIHRVYFYPVFQGLELVGNVVGHIAQNLWNMSQNPRRELQEPFRKGQKGSSKMPHKKNPITLERLVGMAKLVRGYCGILSEAMSTFDEREISQSCVERTAAIDMLITVHYMIIQLTRIVDGMVVFPEQMRKNFDATLGQWTSGYIKDELLAAGVTELLFTESPLGVGENPEEIYLKTYPWLQRVAASAWEAQVDLRDAVLAAATGHLKGTPNVVPSLQAIVTKVGDPHYHLRYTGEIFSRFQPLGNT